jgi:phosphate transport system permease protein
VSALPISQHRTGPRRRIVNAVACSLLGLSVLVALAPLVGVLAYTLAKGASVISWGFFTHSMRGVGPLDKSGGIYHSIIGSVEQVGIAGLLAVPLGLLVAIYIVEYGRGRFRTGVRFLIDVMTGIPSIVAGLFIFTFWVLALHKGFSGLAAGLALSVLMLPVVVRSSEEMLKLVPDALREASLALGVPKWRTIISVVLPAASAGITTGVMLAVARVTGETAPLLLTTFGFDSVRYQPLHGAQSSLPLFVFAQASSFASVAIRRAWAGALTLIAIVLVLTIVARAVTARDRLGAE